MNGIAEAPVRPKNTHAPANPGAAPQVSPGSGGSQPAAEPPDAAQDGAFQLTLKAAKVLQYAILEAGYYQDGVPRLENAHLARADFLLGLLIDPQAYIRDPSDPPQGDTLEHLKHISSELELACDTFDGDFPAIGEAELLFSILEDAYQFSDRLLVAYMGLPSTLDDLRQLTTVAGAKPYRDRPTPPIRRAAPEPDHRDGYTRAQLWCFMEQVAGNLATLNETLMMAQCCDEDWQRDRLLNAAQVMAQSIGCVADHAVGESILGGVSRWHCGRNFPQAGGLA